MGIGEMCHTFPLNDDVRAFYGVNLSRHALQGGNKNLFLWTRQWMSNKPSPFNSVRYLSLAIEDYLGNHLHADKPFHWDKVMSNLPCTDNFNPIMPWIYELNSSVGRIMSDVVTFMDGIRITGFSVENY